jgi:ornithine cyclodeaminase
MPGAERARPVTHPASQRTGEPDMIVLSEADIRALVDPAEAVVLAAEAFRITAAGHGEALRGDLRADDPKRGCLLLTGSAGPQTLTIKSNVHAYPDGPDAPRHWASLLTLWDWSRAEPRALISAGLLNEHRTAAGFAAGLDRLAAPDAATATLFGAGRSAPLTALYLRIARPSLTRLHLVGRSRERVRDLAEALSREPALAGVELVTKATPAEAVAASEIVVTVTTSEEPVFPGKAARPGACIVLGGANRPGAREADDDLIRRADIYLDARADAFAKAGDLVRAQASGALDPARIRGEIGVLPERALPFSPGADVTVFKSMGLPLQDVLLADALVTKALARGLGTPVDLQGAP